MDKIKQYRKIFRDLEKSREIEEIFNNSAEINAVHAISAGLTLFNEEQSIID